MARLVAFLMLGLTACGADSFQVESTAGQPPPRASACCVDADCGDGLLCEGCGDGFKTCVPGCREDAECGPNMLCNHNVECLSCPCPSGWCDLDPCRDLDGDGFAPATEGECPGKHIGDCNDASASVRPGGTERCANGVDDDCDGKRDAADDTCRDSCEQRACSISASCGTAGWCDRGCCEACPAVVDPTCQQGESTVPGGLDTLGCRVATVCVDLSACTSDYAPVCGRNFASYGNACAALAAGTTVLHTGQCSSREGEPCFGHEDCPYQQFCRNMALDAGTELHCAQRGSCSVDADCLLMRGAVTCGDAGLASLRCEAERCVAQCP